MLVRVRFPSVSVCFVCDVLFDVVWFAVVCPSCVLVCVFYFVCLRVLCAVYPVMLYGLSMLICYLPLRMRVLFVTDCVMLFGLRWLLCLFVNVCFRCGCVCCLIDCVMLYGLLLMCCVFVRCCLCFVCGLLSVVAWCGGCVLFVCVGVCLFVMCVCVCCVWPIM